jgi:hypothetical protein
VVRVAFATNRNRFAHLRLWTENESAIACEKKVVWSQLRLPRRRFTALQWRRRHCSTTRPNRPAVQLPRIQLPASRKSDSALSALPNFAGAEWPLFLLRVNPKIAGNTHPGLFACGWQNAFFLLFSKSYCLFARLPLLGPFN